MAPGEVEVRDAGLRFHLPAVREQLARSKRERWALVLGGSASALWWATFTALAPMAQRVPSGAWGAAYWPAMLGLLGLGGAAIVVAVERAAGRRAAIAIALLLASPLPLSLGLIVADASALQAVPSRGFAHTQFVVRPFFNSFEGWHRRYAYRPEIELMTGLVGFALSGLVVLPITVFVVRRLPLAFLRLAPWLVRGLGACAALLVAGGVARAFLRPSVADFPARSVEVATAGGSAPRQDCPACGRERVPCCKLNVGNTGCIRDYGDTLYTEPLGPFVLGRACHGGAKCRLELALPTEGTETNRLIGDTTDLDVVVDLSTPVTLRRSPEHGIHWLFASSVPVAFAGAPDEPPCRSAPRSLACRIDARVSAKSLRGLVGPPRAAVFLGAAGLLVAAWLARTPRRQGGAVTLRIPLQDPPVLEVEPGDEVPTEEARTALLADPRRLTSVLVGHGAYRPVMAILVLVVSLWALVGAALGGYLA